MRDRDFYKVQCVEIDLICMASGKFAVEGYVVVVLGGLMVNVVDEYGFGSVAGKLGLE